TGGCPISGPPIACSGDGRLGAVGLHHVLDLPILRIVPSRTRPTDNGVISAASRPQTPAERPGSVRLPFGCLQRLPHQLAHPDQAVAGPDRVMVAGHDVL